MAGLPWQDPYWVADRRKHWPPKPELWDEVTRQSGTRGCPARYSPELTIDGIQRMELDCVQGAGIEFNSPQPHVRYFFQEFDFDVGASDGRLVRHIYVEYHQSGAVHGRPISVRELRKKGADL